MATTTVTLEHEATHEPGDETIVLPTTGEASALPPPDHGRGAYMTLFLACLVQLPVWGFQQSYGIFQSYYTVKEGLSASSTGLIGPLLTGILYLSSPPLTYILTAYPHLRRIVSTIGALLTAASLAMSAPAVARSSSKIWLLILSQGILHGIGAAMLYTSAMLELDTWFVQRKGLGFALTLSSKSGFGAVSIFLFEAMLKSVGYQTTVYVWAAICVVCGVAPALLLKSRFRTSTERGEGEVQANDGERQRHRRSLDLRFLRHATPWVFIVCTTLFSAGYGLPPTYLPSYAADVLHTSPSANSAMLAVLVGTSVIGSPTFGVLSDGGTLLGLLCCCGAGKRRAASQRPWSIHATTALSAIGSTVPVFAFWGLSGTQGIDEGQAGGILLLVLFGFTYGFFAGGFSATWSGVMKLVEKQGAENGEAVDTGIVFGLLNGGRGVGYVLGGLVGVQLLDRGAVGHVAGYGSQYGSIIIFTGVSAFLGCLGLVWKWIAAIWK